MSGNDISPSARAGSLSLRVAGLFAGIGGIELGLQAAGHRTLILCEIDPVAQAVLHAQFPDVSLVGDVRSIEKLPDADLVTAGFPCQDLSQAGRTRGIAGAQSGLVEYIFRLVELHKHVTWLLLENVPFMLQLDRGRAMHYLTGRLAELGYAWAYRIVDTRAFGLPHRRRRVILLASRTEDPRAVLLSREAGEPEPVDHHGLACGFYWTEGLRGLGWAVDAVPTLKGGSTIGIPSPPGIWMPDGSIVTPALEDAERLQGFPKGWTSVSAPAPGRRKDLRWKLVGNAVSVPVAAWLGQCLREPRTYDDRYDFAIPSGTPWPSAAWGRGTAIHGSSVSAWPEHVRRLHLIDFLQEPPVPLSARATRGFLDRARMAKLRFVNGFLDDVAAHLTRMEGATASTAKKAVA
ncbi:MAG: DNA (cytosine-5-)-methyltransferase [Chloroflexi bacterium]|nr:DNA (cytosine-5-)-methyltransferase [Chloroflexota bacterium]